MKHRTLFVLAMAMSLSFVGPSRSAEPAGKDALVESIDQREQESWEMARKIWEWAEPGYQEVQSSRLLAERLQRAGFKVQTGVAEIPTAIVATVGSGKPVIGVLGEFDALPGLAQTTDPVRTSRAGIKYGHGCGHHLFGVASASAAIALAEQMQAGKLTGTLRYYGCPAEEGGAAKVFMARAGLFDVCDVVLHWHPGSKNEAGDASCLSRIAVKFRFHGKSAHAAGSPEQGRSALDAVELTNHAAQLLREHTPDRTRIHHIITAGGDAPNVVPNFAEVYYYVRHPDSEMVRQLYPRLLNCAKAGALATDTRLEVVYQGGTMELLPNRALSQVMLKNLRELNDLEYDAEEMKFAVRLQNSLTRPQPLDRIAQVTERSGKIGMGSTDVGDVSWIVPTAGFKTACWVPGTPGHSWQAVAAGGMSIGRQGMQLAARVMAASAWDLYHDPALIAAAKAEHRQRLAGRKYQTLLLPGQPPPLDYRDPPNRGK